MNPRRTWTTFLVCSAVALCAIPAAASAKPGYFVFPAGHSIELNLRGSNGYRISVGSQGRNVYLQAARKSTTVLYAVRSLGSKGGEIKARFPGLGRVSMRFQPHGPPREEKPPPFPGCRGGEIVKQPGYLVGTIRFRGERGYTSVSATRVRTVRETWSKEVCKRSDDGSDPEQEGTELYAVSKSRERWVAFDASRTVIPGLPSWTRFGASVGEVRQGMGIFRNIFVSGGAKDVVPGDTRPRPLSGTFTPPAPFRGSGEFRRDAEGYSTWTGSLTVPFPGLGPVALTGPDFSARFCQRSGCTEPFIDGHSLPLTASRHDRIRIP